MIIIQELVQTRKIMDDERKQIILEVLADKYCKQILHDTLDKPKSAMELSSDKKSLLVQYIEDYKPYMMQNYLQFLGQSTKMVRNTFFTRVR